MLRIFVYLLIFVTMACGIPIGCIEDNQCSNGYFCKNSTRFCRECLRCRDLGRNEPQTFHSNCIRSGTDCGLCFSGLIYYNGSVDEKCVPVDHFKYTTIQLYFLLTIIFISIFIIIIFIQVLRNTDVYQISYIFLKRLSLTSYNDKKAQEPAVASYRK